MPPNTTQVPARVVTAHEQVVTTQRFVDCSCGWESNHPRLPSSDEQAMLDAVAEFDAVVVPTCPFMPELHPLVKPTDDEVAALRAWNDWQTTYARRVRPPEPTEFTGDPDPTRTNDTEWQAHVVGVERDAKIEQHFGDGGTIHDLPEEIATMGVEPLKVTP